MNFITTYVFGPFVAMYNDMPNFFLETILNGLTAGVMYALVALGFVLIFKASGIFNFSQGVMALFAALTLVGLMDGKMHLAGLDVHFPGMPVWLAVPVTMIVMCGLAWLIVQVILRKLVHQDPIILFMATIGLTFVLEGAGDLIWGSDIKNLDVGLPSGAWEWLDTTTDGWSADQPGMYVDKLEISALLIGAILVAALALFFQYTPTGRALRAVADNHQAALSVGISLNTIWVTVWTVAGIVALVAGTMWGTKSGVQFSLSLIALKALPVLIIGGFTSVPGAIVGGLIVGMTEKLFESYWGIPLFGGATENWFAYVLAIAFLLVRPQGLFGDKIIERV